MKKIFHPCMKALLSLLVAISCDVFGMEKNQEIISTPKEQKESPQKKNKEEDPLIKELSLTSVQETPYYLWLTICNKTTFPFKIPVKVEVCNTQKVIKAITIRPKKEATEHFNFERITSTLSSLEANFYNKDGTSLLKLTAFRNKNRPMPAYLMVILQNNDETFYKSTWYSDTENDYLVTVNLDQYEKLYTDYENIKREKDRKKRKLLKDTLKRAIDISGALQGSEINVEPISEQLLKALIVSDAKKNGSIIKRLEKTSSGFFQKSQKNNF